MFVEIPSAQVCRGVISLAYHGLSADAYYSFISPDIRMETTYGIYRQHW